MSFRVGPSLAEGWQPHQESSKGPRGYFPFLDFFIVKFPSPWLTLIYPPNELLGPVCWWRRAALTLCEEGLLLRSSPRLFFSAMLSPFESGERNVPAWWMEHGVSRKTFDLFLRHFHSRPLLAIGQSRVPARDKTSHGRSQDFPGSLTAQERQRPRVCPDSHGKTGHPSKSEKPEIPGVQSWQLVQTSEARDTCGCHATLDFASYSGQVDLSGFQYA